MILGFKHLEIYRSGCQANSAFLCINKTKFYLLFYIIYSFNSSI